MPKCPQTWLWRKLPIPLPQPPNPCSFINCQCPPSASNQLFPSIFPSCANKSNSTSSFPLMVLALDLKIDGKNGFDRGRGHLHTNNKRTGGMCYEIKKLGNWQFTPKAHFAFRPETNIWTWIYLVRRSLVEVVYMYQFSNKNISYRKELKTLQNNQRDIPDK